jgi:DNA-binding transcriptional ArsR family regulator
MDTTVIDQAEKQAALCRVLGNSRRLLILWLLSEGELSVKEIAAHVGSTMQNISQHLALLKKNGIVIARREGQTIYYRIADHECVQNCPALVRPQEY